MLIFQQHIDTKPYCVLKGMWHVPPVITVKQFSTGTSFLTHFLCNVMVNLTNHNVRFSDNKSTIYCKKITYAQALAQKQTVWLVGTLPLKQKHFQQYRTKHTWDWYLFIYIYFVKYLHPPGMNDTLIIRCFALVVQFYISRLLCYFENREHGYGFETHVLWIMVFCWYKLGFYFNIFKNVIYSTDDKAEFSASITPGFSVTWSFRNPSYILICCSIIIYFYYQCRKQWCCLISLQKMWYISL